KRGLDIQRGIIRRLRIAGFEIVKVIKGYALVARKWY
ncbi:MAG: methyltransferase, partial [Thermoprotei archaeon]